MKHVFALQIPQGAGIIIDAATGQEVNPMTLWAEDKDGSKYNGLRSPQLSSFLDVEDGPTFDLLAVSEDYQVRFWVESPPLG